LGFHENNLSKSVTCTKNSRNFSPSGSFKVGLHSGILFEESTQKMKILITLLICLSLGYVALASESSKTKKDSFCRNLEGIILDAKDSFNDIRGKAMPGLDGLIDEPFQIYQGNIMMAGATLAYIMSNREYIHPEISICTYVNKFVETNDSMAAINKYHEIEKKLDICLKRKTKGFEVTKNKYICDNVIRCRNYGITIPDMRGWVLVRVYLERKFYPQVQPLTSFVVYIIVSKQ